MALLAKTIVTMIINIITYLSQNMKQIYSQEKYDNFGNFCQVLVCEFDHKTDYNVVKKVMD